VAAEEAAKTIWRLSAAKRRKPASWREAASAAAQAAKKSAAARRFRTGGGYPYHRLGESALEIIRRNISLLASGGYLETTAYGCEEA